MAYINAAKSGLENSAQVLSCKLKYVHASLEPRGLGL